MQSTASPHLPSKHEPESPARPVHSIRAVAVPQTAPPYDDEKAGYTRVPGQVPARGYGGSPQGAEGPAALAGDSGVHDELYHISTDSVRSSQPFAPRPAEPDGWARQFAQVLAETLAGVRPAHQLTPWTSDRARRQIRQLGPLLASSQLPRVRRIMTSAPASDALELTAVVGCGDRVRVLAIRLERQPADAGTGRGWYCTAVESA